MTSPQSQRINKLQETSMFPPEISESFTRLSKEFSTILDFMLEKPLPAKPIFRLSSAPLTASDREIGRKIAEKYGLTE